MIILVPGRRLEKSREDLERSGSDHEISRSDLEISRRLSASRNKEKSIKEYKSSNSFGEI